jgi:hypothetical protein
MSVVGMLGLLQNFQKVSTIITLPMMKPPTLLIVIRVMLMPQQGIQKVVKVQGGPGGPPDFSEAAEQLGVTEEALMEALGQPPVDLEAAEELGVSVEDLTDALPPPPQ